MPSDSLTDDSAFARLVDEMAEQLEAGRAIDWPKYETEWPQYVEELRQMAPTLEAMVALGPAPRELPVSAHSESPAAVGTLGDFRLLNEVGRGGMGIVYEAEQISLGRRVALKVLPFAAMMDSRQLQRFKNEARTAATLNHPHIVSVYSVGCERGLHYFAMQFIEGRSLAHVVSELRRHEAARDKPAAAENPSGSTVASTATLTSLGTANGVLGQRYFRQVVKLGVEAARALDHAHQCGVVHRDVKPSNLLIDNEGKLWVADFGLATTAREADLTMTGDLVGTLRYMSPEQIRGERAVVDHRTDVYSLGVTLYELLTLRQAFSTGDRHELLSAVVAVEPARMRKIRPAIPTDLETIVSTAMQKDASARYQTAESLAADLQRFLDHQPIKARPARAWETATKWVRRRPAWAAFIAVCVLACAAGIGLQFYHGIVLQHALEQTEELRQAGLNREIRLHTQLYSADIARASQLIELDDLVGAHDLLQRYRDPIPGVRERRGPEWEYLARQASPIIPIWTRQLHEAGALAIAVAPDGSQAASADSEGKIKIWNPRDGTPTGEVQAHFGECRALLFSPDGSRLYSSGQDREINVFDAHTWKLIRSCPEAHTRNIYALALNRDGSLLLSGARDEGGIRLWSTGDMSVKLEIESLQGTYAVAFSPDEQEIVSAHSLNTILRWNAATGQQVERHQFGGDASLQALTIAGGIPAIFAAGYDGQIYCLESAGRAPRRSQVAPSAVFAVAWSAQHKTLLTGGGDGYVARWRFGDPAFANIQMGWRRGPADRIHGIAWLPNENRFVTACLDGTIALWDSDAIPTDFIRTVVTGRGNVTGLAYSDDGESLATSAEGQAVTITDLATGQSRTKLRGAYPRGHLHFALDDRRLVGSLTPNRVGIWDASEGRFLTAVSLPKGQLVNLAVSPDRRTAALAIAESDTAGSVAVLDLIKRRIMPVEIPCPDRPVQLDYSPDGRQLVIAYQKHNPEIVDLAVAEGQRHELNMAHTSTLCVFSPSGETIASGRFSNASVHLIDVASRQITHTISLSSKSMARDLAWSPDGRLLAISTFEGNVELWHVPTLRFLYALTPSPLVTKAHLLRFSADGQTLAVSLQEPDERGKSVVVLYPLGDAAAAELR